MLHIIHLIQFKMKTIVLLVLYVALVTASPLRELIVSNIYDEDYFIKNRYVWLPDDNGNWHYEDLQAPVNRKATIEDVTFYVYTRNEEPYIIPAVSFERDLMSSNFNPTLPTVFIIHGWNNDHTSSVNTLIREAVLDTYSMNVIVVDWGGPANNINYVSSKAAAIFVGGIVGDCINYMENNLNYSPSLIFLVGHSLGAHACGAAGARTGGNVHAIVGMDAAKPLFSLSNTQERLDPTDGQFVHVIHTNGAFLGFSDSIGHADYYPNGGNKQPGCGLDLTGVCSHSRAYEYFAESLRASKFIAENCDSYKNYKDGLCLNNDKSLLGTLKIDRSAFGDYYLDTNSEPPYAIY